MKREICKCVAESAMNAKDRWTPGPWSTEDSVRGTTAIVGTDADGGTAVIARLPAWPVESEEQAANARLIAQAPNMALVLAGCADALREAGRDFAQANPHAARPNLYELHEQAARAALEKAGVAQ